MRALVRAIRVLTVALALTMMVGGVAQAGVTWCVKDPIFEIDGRTVEVAALVPADRAGVPVSFELRVAPKSVVTWRLPSGATLIGSVIVIQDSRVSRDAPRLTVRGTGPAYPMSLQVWGSGLRDGTFELDGTSDRITTLLQLQPRAK